MHGMRKNAHEIEVHGVDEFLLVHYEAEFLQLNLLGCGDISSHDSVEGTSKVNMIWVLNVAKNISQLCDILNAGIDDVLIAKEFERKIWRVEVLTASLSAKVNDSVQIKWNDIICKAQRVIQEVVIVPLSEYICMLQLKLVESHLRQGCEIGFSNKTWSKVCLADFGQIVILERCILAWVRNSIYFLLSNSGSINEHCTSDFIFEVKIWVYLDCATIESLSGDKCNDSDLRGFNIINFPGGTKSIIHLEFKQLVEGVLSAVAK